MPRHRLIYHLIFARRRSVHRSRRLESISRPPSPIPSSSTLWRHHCALVRPFLRSAPLSSTATNCRQLAWLVNIASSACGESMNHTIHVHSWDIAVLPHRNGSISNSSEPSTTIRDSQYPPRHRRHSRQIQRQTRVPWISPACTTSFVASPAA